MKRASKCSTYFLSINMLWISNVNSARALPVRPQEFTQVRQIMLLAISVVTVCCLSFSHCQCLDFVSVWGKRKQPQLLKLTSCGEISNTELSSTTSQGDNCCPCLARGQSKECWHLAGVSRRNAVVRRWSLQAPFPNLQGLVHVNKTK